MGKLFNWVSRTQQAQIDRDNLVADYIRRHPESPAVEWYLNVKSAAMSNATYGYPTYGYPGIPGTGGAPPVTEARSEIYELATEERRGATDPDSDQD